MECLFFHSSEHCAIWKRSEARATEARVHVLAPDTTCGSVACDQQYLVSLIGPIEALCAEGVIAVEDPAYNPLQYNLAGSGAYGIPQAMGSMESAGIDWRTNPRTQLRWFVAYVAARYGDACGALNHERAVNWY